MVINLTIPSAYVEKPTCNRCVNYAGDTHLKRNGTKCVLCRYKTGVMVVPKRGSRSKNALPCDNFIARSKVEVKLCGKK